MDAKTFTTFCNEWKSKGALDFTRKSHYVEMMPLFEAHAEVVEVKKDHFHDLGTQNNITTYSPKKETSDRFATAAGLEFRYVEIGTRKEGPNVFVGKAQTESMGPDGQKIPGPQAEYEYDAETRAEIEILENIKKWKDKSKYVGENADIEKKLCLLSHKKKARSQCDTGARVRAIIAAIGMPTGFKDLFSKGDTVYFLFSRVIFNAKNKIVLERMLDARLGTAALIAGPQEPTEGEPRNVTPPDDNPDESGFGETGEEDPYEPYIQALRDMDVRYRQYLPKPEVGVQPDGSTGRWDRMMKSPRDFEIKELEHVLTGFRNRLIDNGIIKIEDQGLGLF